MENNYTDVEVVQPKSETQSLIRNTSGLNHEYLQSYDAWIRIFIIVFLTCGWISMASISTRNEFSSYCNKKEPTLVYTQAIFISISVFGQLISTIVLLSFLLNKYPTFIPFEKIATLFDAFFIVLMIGMTILTLIVFVLFEERDTYDNSLNCVIANTSKRGGLGAALFFSMSALVFYFINVFLKCTCCNNRIEK